MVVVWFALGCSLLLEGLDLVISFSLDLVMLTLIQERRNEGSMNSPLSTEYSIATDKPRLCLMTIIKSYIAQCNVSYAGNLETIRCVL